MSKSGFEPDLSAVPSGSSLPPLSGSVETNPVRPLPRSNDALPPYGMPQQPQQSQPAYGMPPQLQPMYQNSGLARFGAGFSPYTPPQYIQRTYQPQALAPSRGLLTPPAATPAPGGGGLFGGAGGGAGPGAGDNSGEAPTTAPGPGHQALDQDGFQVTANDVIGLVTNPGFTVATNMGKNVSQAQAQAQQAMDAMQAQMQDAFNQDAIAQADAQEGVTAPSNADPDSSGGIGASDGGNGQGGPAQGSNDGPGDSGGSGGSGK